MKTGQSKYHSLIEALVNTILGYIVAVASQEVIFPMFGVHISLGSSMIMGLWFTVVSIIRSFALRRLFNWYNLRG